MRIYGDPISGNCLKVKFTADLLGLNYEWVDVDILAGGAKTPEFLRMNPQGQVPMVQLDDQRVLAQSNAILRYLAAGSRLLPADPYQQAKVDEWLFWEQYSHEPYIAVCRFQMHYMNKTSEKLEPWRVQRGELALQTMQAHLAQHEWLTAQRFTIADIALLAYTRLAHEGGFSLAPYPAVSRWVAACEDALSIR